MGMMRRKVRDIVRRDDFTPRNTIPDAKFRPQILTPGAEAAKQFSIGTFTSFVDDTFVPMGTFTITPGTWLAGGGIRLVYAAATAPTSFSLYMGDNSTTAQSNELINLSSCVLTSTMTLTMAIPAFVKRYDSTNPYYIFGKINNTAVPSQCTLTAYIDNVLLKTGIGIISTG